MKNNRVMLVYADKGQVTIPQGILHLGTYLVQNGFEPVLLDTRVSKFSPDSFKGLLALGISAMTGYQIHESLKVCEIARSTSKEMPIIWGGIHPTILPEQTVAHPFVDIAIRGEGEQTLLEVLRHFRGDGSSSLADIKGISYKTPDGKILSTPERELIDLDSIEPLRYDLLSSSGYSNTNNYFPYIASRGCPFRCTFCYNRGLNSTWRHRSAENVVNDLKIVNAKYGLKRSVHMLDDNFFTNKKFACTVADLKLKNNLDFEWNGSSTIKAFLRYNSEELELFKKAGLKFVRFGAESGSPKIIKQIRKNFTLEDTYQLLEKCKQHEIMAVFSFMTGFPDETDEDRRQTFDLIDSLRSKFGSYFSVKTLWRLVPYPGTDVMAEALARGYPSPSTLEGWAGYGFTNTPRFPWTSRSEFRRLETINHVTRYPFMESTRFSLKALREKGADHLWELASQFRWKRRFFSFPLEWKIRSAWIQKKMGRGSI
ncbi:MAG: hypothetical protein A2X49_15395 [Lentisphaerae bacterium GWF2_52_8]|nr:MAG: hypothetical protein A2X49_15395 [Lentisphaerae bacterium GWF2_52_8]